MSAKHPCPFCGKILQRPPQNRHFRQCPAYRVARPDEFPPDCLCGHESTSLTQMKRHRQSCDTWAARDAIAVTNERIEKTFTKKYGEGVTNAVHVPGAAERKAATMKERYGAENPFSRESSLFEEVQSHWVRKDRTAHLPKDNFARPEIKEKIRQYWQTNHGFDNVTQVPEIRTRQLTTTLERYGDEHSLRVPEIRAKGIKTWIERYGVSDPAQSPDVLERIRQTNLDRYGVEWTTQHPETRNAMNSALRSFMKTDAAKQLYSVTHNEDLYQQTCLTRFGATHPMKNREYARNHLEHSRRAGPNSIERKFQEVFPQFMFTGNGSYWRFLPLLDQNKNPDFMLPGPDPENPFHESSTVVEVFGTYWHSELKTGKTIADHELEVIMAWQEVGMKCIVIWEAEFSDIQKMSERVKLFLI